MSDHTRVGLIAVSNIRIRLYQSRLRSSFRQERREIKQKRTLTSQNFTPKRMSLIQTANLPSLLSKPNCKSCCMETSRRVDFKNKKEEWHDYCSISHSFIYFLKVIENPLLNEQKVVELNVSASE